MMKPVAQGPHDTGLLEYLEDIIGTDQYKPQLEEGAKKCVPCALHKDVVTGTSRSWERAPRSVSFVASTIMWCLFFCVCNQWNATSTA